ncbi:MAG: PDDEXK nuclease domain-containing protein [Bacteroidia bacterium]|nr:PDDEXK nuclease domain-containing protein [Bacteroidia bacterium]
MLRFANEYPDAAILQQAVAKLPWGHNILLIEKLKDKEIRLWYVQQCIENQWSRDVLDFQIKSQLHQRKGKVISNFKNTLPQPQSDLAQQALKDPYIFDFLTLAVPFRERDVENQLVQHVSRFLLELGKGFALVGQQYHLQVSDNDYYIDLLFYHIRLKCYVVIEIKNTRFKPEHTGKLNFYLSAVDSLVKMNDDNPTIGLLLCKEKNSIEAEFALRDINKPMGISEYLIAQNLPENLKSSLPTIEEIESQLNLIDDEIKL